MSTSTVSALAVTADSARALSAPRMSNFLMDYLPLTYISENHTEGAGDAAQSAKR
jgi:hypothetical protein